MSIKDFFVKEKPVFTGIARGVGGFAFGISSAESSGGGESVSGGARFTVPDAPGYTYHVFNDIHSGANFVNDSTIDCDILLVGGGGAGGSDVGAGAAGGGGGGAVVYYPGVSLTAGTYAVHVGEGGHNNYCAYDDNGEPGSNSVFAGTQSGPWPSPFALVALGGGGGGNLDPNANANHGGGNGGCGGGGGSNTGPGGNSHYVAPNPQSLPANSITYGHGGAGRASSPSPSSQRAGGGGGAGGDSAPTSPHSDQNQGGRSGYQVPSTFLPTSCPSDFANLIGGAHPSSLGGAIGTPSPEWRYFGGGGGASDNHNSSQGDGGLGGGGNAGHNADTSPWPLMARTANPYANDTEWGFDKQMAPGTGGRGGGGAGNGSDNPAPQAKQCWGGSGGSGCVIIKAQYTVSDSFAATGGTNQPNGIVSGSYTYHVFADDGNFVVSSGSKSIDFLIVAGGGGGANQQGGGGGAGGVVYGTSVYIGKGTYPVTVGTGGDAGAAPGYANPGAKGNDSTFGGLTAVGGGGGAQNNWGHPGGVPNANPAGPYPSSSDKSQNVVGGSSGGCGGGTKSGAPGPDLQSKYPYMQTPNRGGTTMYNNITQYGNSGGSQSNAGSQRGAGGGGAGGAGSSSGPSPGAGGDGQPFPAFPGPVLSPGMPSPQQSAFATAVGPTGLFGGGGGGGAGPSGGPGGPGGGGAGGNSGGGTQGVMGTGGGGGGSGADAQPGGDGAKGIVIIRYLT